MRYLIAVLLLTLAAPLLAAPAPLSLRNATTALTLDPADGYAVSHLGRAGEAFDFIAPRPEGKAQERSPWLLGLRLPGGPTVSLTAADAQSVEQQAGPDRATITWQGVGSTTCPGALTVTMTVVADAGGKTRWRLAVSGTSAGALWQVDFPRVAGVRPVGDDALLTPLYLGRLTRNPTRVAQRSIISYPSPLSMQFLALYGTAAARDGQVATEDEDGWSRYQADATGLYLAAEDGACHYKRFGCDSREVPGQLRLWVENVPPLPRWPLTAGQQTVDYKLPYDVVLQAFKGDAYTVATLYRDWARQQPWCSRGPADKWPRDIPAAGSKELAAYTPQWFRQAGFWAKFYQEPSKVVPEWAAYRKWLKVPIASHYYRSPIAVFDDNYPEMLPTDPYYVSGMRDARDMDVHPMPYTNGVIWDRDTQSYLGENGEAAAIKDESGQHLTWDISSEFYSYMCPGAKQWRDAVGDTAYKQVAEHGLSGVYLDCLTATASVPCYDASHGHSLRGGNYYAQGQHQMMLDLRRRTRAVDPEACFFPEECGEWVIDAMDGFLTLDISRGYPAANQQVFPLFDLVYHEYTINFGDDVTLDYAPERFAWEMGTMLVWGAVPLHSPSVARPPQAGDPNSEMLRDLVQGYYVAGLPFLQGGEPVRAVVRPPGSPAAPTCGVDLTAAPYSFQYQPRPNVTRTWRGPAVLASAWRRHGDVAVVLVNITDQPQRVSLALDPARVGLPTTAKLVQTWPRETPAPTPAGRGEALTVPARRMMILVATTSLSPALQARALLDTPWELLTAEQGPFQALQAPAGTLWACSDGPVANVLSAAATAATPECWTEQGTAVVREGRRPRLPEGTALPRETRGKPFALLRRLPVRSPQAGTVEVLAGDATMLCCRADGPRTLDFAQEGLALVTAADGTPVRPLARTRRVELPAGQGYWVGYAAFGDGAALQRLLAPLGKATQAKHAALRAALGVLASQPTDAALAAATTALEELEQSLDALPGAFAPETPLWQVHERLRALVSARLATALLVQAADDWLAPGLPRPVQVAQVRPGAGLSQPALQAVGTPRGGFAFAAPRASGSGWQTALNLSDPGYVERLVPVRASAGIRLGGKPCVLSDVLLLDAERPLELQTQALAVAALAGVGTEAAATLRNWSPFALQVTVATEGPTGWQVGPPQTVAVPALTNVKVKLPVQPAATAPRGTEQLRVRATYAAAGSVLAGLIDVNVQPLLAALGARDGRPPQEAAAPLADDQLARIRQYGRLVLIPRPGQPLEIAISNVRVTQYASSLEYRLLSPDFRPLQSRKIAVDESERVRVDKPLAGAYLLEVHPLSGSATVRTNAAAEAEFATKAEPLRLFCSAVTRYFYVPAGAKSFALGAQDGGPDEGARLVVTSPTGRVAFTMSGNYSGGEFPIEVRPEEAGRVWTLRVEPLQDLSLWLSGDACPYLSATPDRVVVEARAVQ